MKPENYTHNSNAFDFFNSDIFFTDRHRGFIRNLSKIIPENAKVTDVGGGTALFISELMQMRPDIKLTFIEPSTEMFEKAKERLPDHCTLINKPIEEVLPDLETQDVFILMRVLYALYKDTEKYKELFSLLYNKLNNGGHLCILEVDGAYNIKEYKAELESRLTGPDIKIEFEKNWPDYRELLEIFNKRVADNTFTIFSSKELDHLLNLSGFTKTSLWNRSFVYTKPEETSNRQKFKLKNYYTFPYGHDSYLLNIDTMESFRVNKRLCEELENTNGKPLYEKKNPALFKALKQLNLIVEYDNDKNYVQTPPASVPVNHIMMNVTQTCNLGCTYCYGVDGEYDNRGHMSREIAFKTVDWLVDESGDNREQIGITFFGGEPLLNFDLIKEVVTYAVKKSKDAGKKVKFSMVTNGTLLDDVKAEYLKENDFHFNISFDALPESQNKNRPFKDGRGTYDTVTKNLLKLMDADTSVRVTVADENIELKKIRDTLVKSGIEIFSITVASPTILKDSSRERKDFLYYDGSESSSNFCKKLLDDIKEQAQEVLTAIKERKPIYSKLFIRIIKQLRLKEGKLYYCGLGKGFLGVANNGDIYPCHRFNGIDSMKMGNVSDYSPTSQRQYTESHVLNIEKCKDCYARFFCGGGCFYESIEINGEMSEPSELWCKQLRLAVKLGIVIYGDLDDSDKKFLASLKQFRKEGIDC